MRRANGACTLYHFALGAELACHSIFDERIGGGLALSVLLKLRELGQPLPAGGILLSPWVQLDDPGHGGSAAPALPATDPINSIL